MIGLATVDISAELRWERSMSTVPSFLAITGCYHGKTWPEDFFLIGVKYLDSFKFSIFMFIFYLFYVCLCITWFVFR